MQQCLPYGIAGLAKEQPVNEAAPANCQQMATSDGDMRWDTSDIFTTPLFGAIDDAVSQEIRDLICELPTFGNPPGPYHLQLVTVSCGHSGVRAGTARPQGASCDIAAYEQ